MAICEKSAGALIRKRPRGCSLLDAIAAALALSSARKRTGALIERQSFLRELYASRSPFEKPDLKVAFEFAHPSRKRRLRTTRGASRLAEASVTSDEVEISKCKKIHSRYSSVPLVRHVVSL